MRHLGSLVLCLVLGPVIYLGLGFGLIKELEGRRDLVIEDDAGGYLTVTLAIVSILVVAGLFALLIFARLSPLGTMVLGLAFLGLGLWSTYDPANFTSTMPSELFGQRGLATAAGGAASLLFAVPLLGTVFSPRRWRRWGDAPAAVAPQPNYSPPPVNPYSAPPYASPQYQTPQYQTPQYQQPSYGFPPSSAETTVEYPTDTESTRRL